MNLIITKGLQKGGQCMNKWRDNRKVFNRYCLWNDVESAEFINDFFGLASNSAWIRFVVYDRILAYFFFLFSKCSNTASERPDWGSCDEPENLIFIRSRSCRSLSHLRAVCPNVCGADCDPFVTGDWKQCHLSFWSRTHSGSYSRKTGFGVSGIIHFASAMTALGPTLGGFLMTIGGWPAIF